MRDNVGLYYKNPSPYTRQAIDVVQDHIVHGRTSFDMWEALTGLEFVNVGEFRPQIIKLRHAIRIKDFYTAKEIVEKLPI